MLWQLWNAFISDIYDKNEWVHPDNNQLVQASIGGHIHRVIRLAKKSQRQFPIASKPSTFRLALFRRPSRCTSDSHQSVCIQPGIYGIVLFIARQGGSPDAHSPSPPGAQPSSKSGPPQLTCPQKSSQSIGSTPSIGNVPA